MTDSLQPGPCRVSACGPCLRAGRRRKPTGIRCHNLHLGCDTTPCSCDSLRAVKLKQYLPTAASAMPDCKGPSGPQAKSTSEIPGAALIHGRGVLGQRGWHTAHLPRSATGPTQHWAPPSRPQPNSHPAFPAGNPEALSPPLNCHPLIHSQAEWTLPGLVRSC